MGIAISSLSYSQVLFVRNIAKQAIEMIKNGIRALPHEIERKLKMHNVCSNMGNLESEFVEFLLGNTDKYETKRAKKEDYNAQAFRFLTANRNKLAKQLAKI